MDWIFGGGRSAKNLKAWRFIQPGALALVFYAIAFGIGMLKDGILMMPHAPVSGSSFDMLDWMSLGAIAVAFLISLYALYQAYQDFVHGKWQEDAWCYRNGDYY